MMSMAMFYTNGTHPNSFTQDGEQVQESKALNYETRKNRKNVSAGTKKKGAQKIEKKLG